MTRWITAVSLVLLGSGAFAAPPKLDAEPTTPYPWRVVLRCDPHPSLTPAFRAQIGRDLQAALQPAFGEVARVEIIDLATIPAERRDPLMTQFRDKGWPALDAPEFRQITGLKTHFLWISVRQGNLHLEARQHDGSTGLVSPVIRIRETRAAETVGRLAGLMIAKDFGPVGTLELDPSSADRVMVRFRGGQLPGFDRCVREGDVLAVSIIREQKRAADPRAWAATKKPTEEPPAVRIAQPRQYTLLIVEETPNAQGMSRCKVILGSGVPPLSSTRGALGFRALKLATVEGPVQVRVVDQEGTAPTAGSLLQVRASDIAFTPRPDPRDSLELREGVFRSPRPLRNIAFVVIGLGAAREWRLPMPVLGDGPQVVRLDLKADDARKAAFERECQDLRGRVAEARVAHAALVQTLTQLIVNGKNKEALERATSGLASLVAADTELTAELDRLKQQPLASDPIASALIEASAEQLQAVRAGKTGIEQRVGELKDAVAKLDNPARFEKEFKARELAAEIKQRIEVGDIPEALNLYDQLYSVTEQADIKKQKEKLAADWEPKNDEHRQAREYVLDTWRKAMGLAEFKDALIPLQKAVDTMVANKDRYGLRNMLASLEPAYAKIKEILDTLDPNTDADREAVKDVQTISQGLKKIEDGAREALKKIEMPAAAPPAP